MKIPPTKIKNFGAIRKSTVAYLDYIRIVFCDNLCASQCKFQNFECIYLMLQFASKFSDNLRDKENEKENIEKFHAK